MSGGQVEPWEVHQLEARQRQDKRELASSLTALTSRVTAAEGSLSACASAIGSLETRIAPLLPSPRADDLSWLAQEHGVVPEHNSPMWVVLGAAAACDGEARKRLLSAVERMAGNPLLACPMPERA